MFAFGETLYRHRYPLKADPYNPAGQIPDRTQAAQTITLSGGFLDAPSTVRVSDPVRTQTITDKALYLSDATVDVINGDLVGSSEDPDVAEYIVDGETSAPKNPFTGWQPVREVPLRKVTG